MHLFFFRRTHPRGGHLSLQNDLGRVNGSPGYRLVNGTWRLHRQPVLTTHFDKNKQEFLYVHDACNTWSLYAQLKKYCKPVSRILLTRPDLFRLHHCYHLSEKCITTLLYLPTLDHRASSPQAILYMAFQHARFTLPACYQAETWALTPHFHPHHAMHDSYFLWHCLLAIHHPAVNRYVALCCPDFPTLSRIGSTACSVAKISC